jgi:hypothetical protein
LKESRITRFCWEIQHVIGNPNAPIEGLGITYALCNEGNSFDEDCQEKINGELKVPEIPSCLIDIMVMPTTAQPGQNPPP